VTISDNFKQQTRFLCSVVSSGEIFEENEENEEEEDDVDDVDGDGDVDVDDVDDVDVDDGGGGCGVDGEELPLRAEPHDDMIIFV